MYAIRIDLSLFIFFGDSLTAIQICIGIAVNKIIEFGLKGSAHGLFFMPKWYKIHGRGEYITC